MPAGYRVCLPYVGDSLPYSTLVMYRPLATILLATPLAAGPLVARADIYGYVDASGTAHFSNVPNDARYELIVRTAPEPGPTGAVARGDEQRARFWLARSGEYDAAIRRAAEATKVRPELVRAVIVVESGFNPRALSRRGAIGLMQLLPATARRYGAFNAFEPEQNIRAGTHYLADLITHFGPARLDLVLAAYNAGVDAVHRFGNQIPPFKETQGYVPNVLRMYQALRKQAADAAGGDS